MNKTTSDKLRDLLTDLVVNGDDLGWVEYTDGGVWVTDKGVAQINQLIVEARIDEAKLWFEEEPLIKSSKYRTNLLTDTDYFYAGRIANLQAQLNKEVDNG